jgi:hypothetical protein
MPTVAAVQSAIRTRLEANFTAITVRWKNEDFILPDTPAPFVLVELIVEDHSIAGYGGGRLANLWRTDARIEAHVFMIAGTAMATGLGYAEDICAVFRSQRVDDISYGGAEVFPGDGEIQDGNMAHVASTVIDLFFDKVG